MSRGAKVFFSCAAGAGIGALVALEMSAYLWWVGLLVGALAGYLFYDFKRAVKAVPVAWHKAVNWHPDWEAIKEGFAGGLCVFLIGSILVGLLTLVTYGSYLKGEVAAIGVIAVALIPSCMFFSLGFARGYLDGQAPDELWFIATRFNVVVAPFTLLYYGARFFWQLFRLIHSEIRVLCAVDAAIGAGIGYLYGNALIGAFAGGLIGLLKYEIVSKRWLKLAPVKENAS